MYLQKVITKKHFFVGILNVNGNILFYSILFYSIKWQDLESNPDPFVRGTVPRIPIRTIMSRIRSTAYKLCELHIRPLSSGQECR
jgi:hypothetical protein